MRIVIAIWTIALLATGCAMSPPLPQIQSKHGDRVGVIVEISDEPLHTHVGTTVFNNFAKKYPYDWKLSSRVAETVKSTLTKFGITAVDLKAEGLDYSNVSGLIQPAGQSWKVDSAKHDILKRLRDQLKLKAVIVLKEARVMTALECSGGPCSERYADTSGLYTRGFFGATNYSAVAAFKWNVFVLDPLADTAAADPIMPMLRMPAVPLIEFQKPADLHNITEAELAPVRDAILSFTESVSTHAAESLNIK